MQSDKSEEDLHQTDGPMRNQQSNDGRHGLPHKARAPEHEQLQVLTGG